MAKAVQKPDRYAELAAIARAAQAFQRVLRRVETGFMGIFWTH
jgi:hypothetical protein